MILFRIHTKIEQTNRTIPSILRGLELASVASPWLLCINIMKKYCIIFTKNICMNIIEVKTLLHSIKEISSSDGMDKSVLDTPVHISCRAVNTKI